MQRIVRRQRHAPAPCEKVKSTKTVGMSSARTTADPSWISTKQQKRGGVGSCPSAEMMKSEVEEPVSGSATRCSTPLPGGPPSPESASQVLPSPEEKPARSFGLIPPLSLSRPSKRAHHRIPSRPQHANSSALTSLGGKRAAPAENAMGFTEEDAVTYIHDFKRDAFEELCMQHRDLASLQPPRTGILQEGDAGERHSHRPSQRVSILERSVMSAVLAKSASAASSKPRMSQAVQQQQQQQQQQHVLSSASSAAAPDRDLRAGGAGEGQGRDRDKLERLERTDKDPKLFPPAPAPSAAVPSPSSVDAIAALQPSLSINLYPGGFSIDGRPTAHLYEAAHMPLLRSIGAGKLPVGSLLDVPNTEHLQFHNGCLLAEIKDHRMPVMKLPQHPAHSAVTRRVLLQADHLNTIADVEHMRRVCGPELSVSDALKVEQDIMMRLQMPVCLEPSPNVSLVSNYSQFIRNAARPSHPRPPLSSYKYQRPPSDEEQRAVLNSCKFEQEKTDSFRRTPKKPARSSAADGSEVPDSLPDAAKVVPKITAGMFLPTPMAAPPNCTKPAIRRLRFSRKASGVGKDMTATIWVEMRRPSVYEGVVRVEEYCTTPQGMSIVQKPSCAQYQIGNALQVM